MNTPRDRAVRIATTLFRKLFERVWFPWTPEIERGVTRLVDLIIEAAAEHAQRQPDDAFLRELIGDAPLRKREAADYETVKFRRDDDREFWREQKGMGA